jgi:hypothetical protein
MSAKPPSTAYRLTYVGLDSNRGLIGTIPDAWTALRNLSTLNTYGSGLCGPMPAGAVPLASHHALPASSCITGCHMRTALDGCMLRMHAQDACSGCMLRRKDSSASRCRSCGMRSWGPVAPSPLPWTNHYSVNPAQGSPAMRTRTCPPATVRALSGPAPPCFVPRVAPAPANHLACHW